MSVTSRHKSRLYDHLNDILLQVNKDVFSHATLAKTEIIYPKNVGALVAMNFT